MMIKATSCWPFYCPTLGLTRRLSALWHTHTGGRRRRKRDSQVLELVHSIYIWLKKTAAGAFYLHFYHTLYVAPVALSLKMTLIRHAVSLFPSKCTSMQWKFKHRRLKYAKIDSVLIKGFEAMFRSKKCQHWHTRRARWCNNCNLDNHFDIQCWQPILTTDVYNQCLQPMSTTNVDNQCWLLCHCSGHLLIPYGTCTTHDQGVHQRKMDVHAGRQGEGGASVSRCI